MQNKGKRAYHYNPDFTGKKNPFSNKQVKGCCVNPVCITCGVLLTIDNTYKNFLARKMYTCKDCCREQAKVRGRERKLNTTTGNLTVKRKIPKYPDDNKCQLCGRHPNRSKGLSFHHWIIDGSGITVGIWVCCVCHMFAERVDHSYLDKYLSIKAEHLGLYNAYKTEINS